ncbi:VOC family protein [Yinghuangia seranimata]|uniref:VOC family protein n=1 Tax=Yinghuangia seranimata TaxID=408067 RepID=UPI00248AE77B|nr:VOC family protein [Yinghuangia seranimata]MDI2131432.1 VOC family protein [Yinghuangia seranimata]
MTRPALDGIHHVKFPVSDLPRSLAWYRDVFGLTVVMEFPDEGGVPRGVAATVPGLGETMFALRENPDAAAGCKGFDPVSFAVRDRADVEAWAAHLDTLGVPHSPVIEASIGWILVFHDPDGLELHVYTWARHGQDHGDLPGYGRAVPE